MVNLTDGPLNCNRNESSGMKTRWWCNLGGARLTSRLARTLAPPKNKLCHDRKCPKLFELELNKEREGGSIHWMGQWSAAFMPHQLPNCKSLEPGQSQWVGEAA